MIEVKISDTMVTKTLVRLKVNTKGLSPVERRAKLGEEIHNATDQDKLRFLRCNADMTQEDFGKLFGHVASAVSYWESGVRKIPFKAKQYIREHFPAKEEE